MAYQGTTSTSPNPPVAQSQAIAGPREWIYSSTHVASDVAGANFFTDGLALGFKVGDRIIVSPSTGGEITSHTILVVGATTTDVSVGSTIGLAS